MPDNGHNAFRPNPIREFFAGLFEPKRLMQKYRTANRTLDIHNLIEREVFETKNAEQAVADVLSRAFGRSCAIFGKKRAVSSWQGEDLRFFEEPNELAVAEWSRKNGKPVGKGTETLRAAKAIYFPIETGHGAVILAFSCIGSKMSVTDRFVFNQTETLLKLIL